MLFQFVFIPSLFLLPSPPSHSLTPAPPLPFPLPPSLLCPLPHPLLLSISHSLPLPLFLIPFSPVSSPPFPLSLSALSPLSPPLFSFPLPPSLLLSQLCASVSASGSCVLSAVSSGHQETERFVSGGRWTQLSSSAH